MAGGCNIPLTLDAMNGMRSRVAAGSNMREGDPEFYRMIDLLRKIQKSGAVGMRIKKRKGQRDSTVLFFHQRNLSPEVKKDLGELNRMLGLAEDANEITVKYGLIPENNREVTMLTRSMLQIMIEMGTMIDVPDQHVENGQTLPDLYKLGYA